VAVDEPGVADLEEALTLLSFPREIGLHPESGKPIMARPAATGRTSAATATTAPCRLRVTPDHHVDGAVELLKQPKSRGRRPGRRRCSPSSAAPDLGRSDHGPDGRFGPYVSDGTVHATVPKTTDPAAVTLETAVELLAAREDKLRSQGKDPAPRNGESLAAPQCQEG